ncbi:ATP-binding protein [Puniceicoccaceae bacterium K14]|nr:ATP-binding protein [Puniceicoccaceae bacterium K14]
MKREGIRRIFRLSFQSKILLPVIGVLIALPVLMVGLLNNYVRTEALKEAERTLTTADSVFLNSLDIKKRLLLDRFRNLGNEPRTKAVASLNDSNTMSGFLDDLIFVADERIEVILYTSTIKEWQSGACREDTDTLESFARLVSEQGNRLYGDYFAEITVLEGRPYHVISVPVYGVSGDFSVGVLTIGMRIGNEELVEQKSLSKADVLLIADGKLLSGTLSSEQSSEFLDAYAQEELSYGEITPQEIGGESFHTLSGRIENDVYGSLDYILLSSFEKRLQALRSASAMLWGLSALGVLISVLVIFITIRKLTRPLTMLRDGAELVGQGDFSQRVECDTQDECGQLASAFNRMTSNLQRSRSELEKTVVELQSTQEQLLSREARLRESEEGLRLIIEGARDHLIFTIDDEQKILRWNATAHGILGYSVSEAQGMQYSKLYDDEDSENHYHSEILDTARKKGQVGFEGWRRRQDGTRFWADITVSRIERLAGAKGGGYVEITRDVSARKEAEIAMKKAKDAAEASDRAKSEFLANMSHEVRTPLNGIIGMTGLLSQQNLTDEQRDFVDTIGLSADSLLAVIDDILDISKIESGKLEITHGPVDLVDLIEEVAKAFEPTCLEKNLSFAIVIEKDVPKEVETDASRLRQTLVNLVDNAVKFTETGGVNIVLSATEEDQLSINVTDTGIGISQENLDNLFKPFFQVESSFARQYGGTGLGLAISQNIATLLGGNISVTSEEGNGSAFCLQIVAKRLSNETRFEDLKRNKVLIVADAEKAGEALSEQLSIWNADVARVSSLPDLILDRLKKDPRQLVVVEQSAVRQDTLKCLYEYKKSTENVSILFQCESDSSDISFSEENRWSKIGRSCYPRAFNTKLSNLLGLADKEEPSKGLKKETTVSQKKSTKTKSKDPGFALKYPLKILVVEDNPINLKILNRILLNLGYETDQAENGQLAVEAAEAKAYDFIFMDLQMPVMNGLDACRQILDSEKVESPVYISAFTANSRQEDIDACKEVGMHDFGSKPARVEVLKEILVRGFEWRQASLKTS